MPLRDSDNTIIGVVTLINKRFGCFTNNDEDFVEAFGVFAGHSLENVSKLDQVKQAEEAGAAVLIQMDSNAWLGQSMLKNDPKPMNRNGKCLKEFLERNSNLYLVNLENLDQVC